MRILVLFGSVRTYRAGERVVHWVQDVLEDGGHDVDVVDPARIDLPMLDRMYKEFDDGEAPPSMDRVAQDLRSADGFVIVSAEYNHGIPPALKNLLDHFQAEYFWRPAAIVTYSASRTGGARVQTPLRATLGELGMVTIPTMIEVPRVEETLKEDGTRREDRSLGGNVEKFVQELEWYGRALARGIADGVPYDDPRDDA